jgi:hypothetical protein
MSLTLGDLRRLLRKSVGGLDSNDVSDAECDELLNISLWSIEDQFPFELKETVYSTPLVEGQAIYNLSGISKLDALYSIAVVDDDGDRIRLNRMTRTVYDETHSDEDAAQGFPAHYFREGAALYVEPTPSNEEDGFTLELAVKESIDSLASGSQEATGLPRNWDEIVLQGAIGRFHNINQDYDLRDKAINYQLSLIRAIPTTEAKEETDSHHAGLQVKWE